MDERIVSRSDMEMLKETIIESASKYIDITLLERELSKAKVVENDDIPRNVVAMNSRVLIAIDGEELEITLVLPHELSLDYNRISVLSPVGTAILGYPEGSKVEWELPSGKKIIEIRKILHQV